MQLGDTHIEDTFAEAFGMRYTRLIVTAADDYWLEASLREFTGYSSSVIACDAEIGLERRLTADETPDGRTGAAVMAFGMSRDALTKAIPNRVGQCLMTCPSTAVYNGLVGATEKIPIGKHIRFFGDGYQKSKRIAGRRYWRIPVMDGEFLVEESAGVAKGVAGGNIILQANHESAALAGSPRRGSDRASGRGHHSVSRRSRPEREQSRFPVQGTGGFHVRFLLPHAPRPGRIAIASPGQLCLRNRDRWRKRNGGRSRHDGRDSSGCR